MSKALVMPESASVNLKKAVKAFQAGERSDRKLHQSLMDMLVFDFYRKDYNTVGLAWFLRFMQNENPDSARFRAVVHWLRTVANFQVKIDEKNLFETNLKCTKGYTYGKEWLAACKATPWFVTARQMQKAKPWVNRVDTVLKDYAKGYIMGDITRDDLLDIFVPKRVDEIIREALHDEKLQKSVAERMAKLDKQGELVSKAA